MSLESNKTLVRNYLEEIYRGNLDILDEVIAEEYVVARGTVTPADYRASFSALRRSFPDIAIHFVKVIAEDDWVALHCTIKGTHLGEWRGIAPTGKHATWTATAFRQVRDGKLVTGYSSWDWLSVMQQIGVTFVPPTPTDEAMA